MKILDPSGFTVENNKHKWKFDTPHRGEDWMDYMEFDDDGFPIKCHMCLKRAENNNGNCIDGGAYFICMKTENKKVSVQTIFDW